MNYKIGAVVKLTFVHICHCEPVYTGSPNLFPVNLTNSHEKRLPGGQPFFSEWQILSNPRILQQPHIINIRQPSECSQYRGCPLWYFGQ